MKKIIALILCVVTVLTCVPMAFAEGAEPEQAEAAEADGVAEANLDDVAEAAQNSASSAKHKFVVRGAIVLALGCFVAFVLPNIAKKTTGKKQK